MFNLDQQVAIVTGASRGLGREMATALAAQGATVVICSRKAEESQATAAEIAAATGSTAIGVGCDVTRRDDIELLVEGVIKRFQKIDILINNAGSGMRKPLLEVTDDEWEKIISLNLGSPFMVTRSVAPHMIEQRYGRIINISSALGKIALPERAAYCSSKGGLLQLTKVMALEWALHNITVNAICPGPFRTEYNLHLQENPQLYESYLNLIPQHRWADLSEIRAAAVYLASREASFVTGTALCVDGGWTAHAGLPEAGATDPD